MSSLPASGAPAATPWTCPFCALLCDGFEIARDGDRYALRGSDCPRATAALQRHPAAAATPPGPRIGDQPVSLDRALDEAARRLAAARQPLFGGLATDLAGARALYPLALATGAICDPAGGDTLMHGLRALQDRGAFTTTLAEVRNRADLIVCLGDRSPREDFPEIWRRCGIGEPAAGGAAPQARELVFVGAPMDAALQGRPGITQRSVALGGDLFDAVAQLAACADRQRIAADPALQALAERLLAARYAVIVWQAGRLPAQGALIAEAINRLVGTLNRRTRAAALPLAGNDGLGTVNQAFAWLSGLPLRSRAGPLGLEHEPLQFAAPRLIDGGDVDALLWLAGFGPEPALPSRWPSALPTVVIGHPATQVPDGAVFIPSATPGIGRGGHLFRTDGVVALPLEALHDDPLPGADEVLQALNQRVRALQARAAGSGANA